MSLNFFNKLFMGFQEPATPIMEGIIDFHNYIFFFLVLILIFVLFVMFNILIYFWYFFERPSTQWELLFREVMFFNNKITHGTALEVIWTIIPAVILMIIAFPSFSLLYSMDEVMMPAFTLKVVGHQWYWSYEYTDQNNVDFIKSVFFKNFFLNEDEIDFEISAFISDIAKSNKSVKDLNLTSLSLDEKIALLKKLSFEYFNSEVSSLEKGADLGKLESLVNISIDAIDNLNYENLTPKVIESTEFDSYMVPESDLNVGDHRLLEVTEAVVLPINTYIRVLVTSADVLHSFSVNSLGIKADAVPGRLNQLSVFLKRSGVFYGQCSEICGVSHGMMPIVVRGVSLEDYIKWLVSMGPKGFKN